MGIKDNFSQAVKELWKKDGQEQNAGSALGQPSELDRYLQQQNAAQQPAEQPAPTQPSQTAQPVQPTQTEQPLQGGQSVQTNPAGQPTQAAQSNQYAQQPAGQGYRQSAPNQSAQSNPSQGGQNMNAARASQAAPAFGGQAPVQPNANGYYNGGFGGGFVPPEQGNGDAVPSASETDEITVISKNTVIDGNIHSLANMQIDGNIKGNVETTRDIDMTGKIVGDITCNNAGMSSAAMQGNVALKGRMRMDRDTILIGDLTSQYADVNGRIRGKLDIAGKAELKRDAIVFGDINASTIAVTDGAIIQGYVNTTFLSKEDSRSAIPEAITFDSKESSNL